MGTIKAMIVSTPKVFSTFLLVFIASVHSFSLPAYHDESNTSLKLFPRSNDNVSGKQQQNENNMSNNPVSEFFDMFSTLDSVVDDFYFKRMGNGEIFYGKRKYKPSGQVEGEYQGLGLSDKLKIDMTREYKRQREEERNARKKEM